MKHKNLKLSSVLLLGIGLTGLQAQESVNTTGGDAMGSGGSVSYSVGQVVYTTSTGTNSIVAQGVQQPFEISTETEIEKAKSISLTISAFPNPTSDNLTLNISEFDISNLSYQLYDMRGKLLQSQKITGNQTSIVMSNLVPATYFVKVVKTQGIATQPEVHYLKSNNVGAKQFSVVKTFKIIKN